MNRENLKKLLLSLNESDYESSVDLHIHTTKSDGKSNPDEVIEQAKKLNKKYIAITDHNSIEAYKNIKDESNENFLIPSVEFDCFYKGVVIHILGYGIDINNIDIKPLLAKNHLGASSNLYRIFNLRKAKNVIETIKKAGGISVLAHPACYWCINLDNFVKSLVELGLEGIETYYKYRRFRKYFKFHSKKEINKAADKYNLIKTGGSDFHGKIFE